jgi:hypothetical protein
MPYIFICEKQFCFFPIKSKNRRAEQVLPRGLGWNQWDEESDD